MKTFLNGYEIMWMMVLFDLPVMTKEQRFVASRFRNDLLDEGFTMNQYSVYFKVISGKDSLEANTKRLIKRLPQEGKVNIVAITDKQYENIISYENHELAEKPTKQAILEF